VGVSIWLHLLGSNQRQAD